MALEMAGSENETYEYQEVQYNIATSNTPEEIKYTIVKQQLAEGYLRLKYPRNFTFAQACHIAFTRPEGFKLEKQEGAFDVVIISEVKNEKETN